MLIEDKALKHWINNFYGYGSWNARIWFVDYEEGGGDTPEEVAEKFSYFHNAHPSVGQATLCDIRELYRHVAARITGTKAGLFANLYEYRFDNNALLHGVWKNLIAFVHGYNDYRGKKLPDLLKYQKHSLASPSLNSEALIQLYPLPSTHNHAWYYSWLDLPNVDFLKSRASYEEHVYEHRINTILQKITLHKPEVVVMFGMNNINVLKSSVQEIFPEAKFKMVKGVKLQTPQHHRAEFDGTTMIITTQVPALRHNRIETGFDWLAFGKLAK